MTQKFKEIDAGWIKEIPVDWNLKKVKEVYEFFSVKVSDTEYPALTVSSKYGITPQMDHVAKTLNGDSRKRVERGDFVINSRADRPGACGISDYDGSVSMICHVLKPRDKEILHDKYMHYLFRNNMFSQEFFRWGRGIVSDLWSTRKDEFGSLQLPIPPLNDQKNIGEYLEYKEKSINTLIDLKEKQLEKFNEQRLSLITEVVTKGLNPNVIMKDSGVEWIGEIPEHWEVKKVKHFATHIGSGKTPLGGSEVYLDEGVPFLRSLNVHFDGIRLKDLAFISEETNVEMKSSQVKPLDILLNITGASIGRTAIVPKDFGRANVNQHVCIIRLNQKKMYPYYFNMLMSSDVINQQIWFAQNGSSREGLNFVQVKELTFAVPPTLEEQREINEWVFYKQQAIYDVMSTIKEQIEKLKEYRQALIYEAVTGKIDVRGMELDLVR